MTMTTMASEPTRRSRRVVVKPSRLGRVDMRSRAGKAFANALAAARAEFGDGEPHRVAEIARLRLIAERAQIDHLAGKVTLDRVVRAGNMLVRCERQLA